MEPAWFAKAVPAMMSSSLVASSGRVSGLSGSPLGASTVATRIAPSIDSMVTRAPHV